MRILLICGIVFVHVPHDQVTGPYLATSGLFDWLRVFLGDSLFRIGVPCLSAISGYLLFQRGWDKFDYWKTLRSKCRTVVAPFLLWNLGLLLVVLLIQRAGIGVGYFPDLWNSTAREFTRLAFATEGLPINIPLYFLRDLIVCILLSPVLALLVQRFPLPTLGCLFLLAVMPGFTLVIVLKKTILFSFTVGIFLALNRIDLKMLDRFAVAGTAVTLGAALLLSLVQFRTGPDFPPAVDAARNALSMIGAGGFWLFSSLAIRSSLGRRLSNTGSLSFWIFCAHYPLLVAMWMIWNRIAGDAVYPAFYLGAAVLSFTILAASSHLTRSMMPGLYEVLTGSRGRKAKLAPSQRDARSADRVQFEQAGPDGTAKVTR